MNAEKYLENIQKIDEKIKNKFVEYAHWEEIARNMGGFSASESVQSSRNLSKMADAVGRYTDIEREIKALEAERREILGMMEKLPPFEFKVLSKLYVQGLYMKEAANACGRSYDWVRMYKKSGLAHIQEILDAKEKE